MFNSLAPLDDDEQNTRDPFGRVMPKPEPDHEISNLGNITALNQPVGEQGKNTRPDVAKVETMLGHAGTLDLKQTKGPTGYWGERTREATRAFQKQNGLKVDGLIEAAGKSGVSEVFEFGSLLADAEAAVEAYEKPETHDHEGG